MFSSVPPRRINPIVLRLIRAKHEIFRAIVLLVAVYMVNDFCLSEVAANHRFHDQPVFVDASVPIPVRMVSRSNDADIAIHHDCAAAIPAWVLSPPHMMAQDVEWPFLRTPENDRTAAAATKSADRFLIGARTSQDSRPIVQVIIPSHESNCNIRRMTRQES